MNTTEAAKRFATNLRRAINEKDWNLKQAAEMCGLPEVWIRKAATKGVRRPTEDQLQKLVATFGRIDWYSDQSQDVGELGRKLESLIDVHPWLEQMIEALYRSAVPPKPQPEPTVADLPPSDFPRARYNIVKGFLDKTYPNRKWDSQKLVAICKQETDYEKIVRAILENRV